MFLKSTWITDRIGLIQHLMTSSHTTSSKFKKGGSKINICSQAKSLNNSLFKSPQKRLEESGSVAEPTTSLGMGGMALAVLMIMAVLCQASASSFPATGSTIQENRRDLAAFNNFLEPYEERQLLAVESPRYFLDKRNAELINGLIGMDLNRLSAMGKKRKRGNAELINGLIGMDLDRLSTMGKKKR